ncbi:DUF1015 domain-containing protein [Actinomadura alba]
MDDDLPSGRTPAEFSARIFGAYERNGDAGLELAPFRGVRFAPGTVDLAAVTTPPYDLIGEDEMRRLLDSDARNIVRLILPWDGVSDPGTCYGEAADLLRRWLADGTLVTDAEPALYVYEERNANSLQRGLIGALGLRPESARVVLPHEDVFPGPVRDRLRLMAATQANLEPIFLLYEGGGDAGRLVDETAASAEPDVQVTVDDGLTHRLWRVTDPAVQARISADLRDRQALIADGHHRYATYRALQARHHAAGDGTGPWDHGLALLVDSTRYPPHLGAIHRVLPGLAPAAAIEGAKAVFRVTDLPGTLHGALEALRDASGPAFLLGGGAGLHLLTDPDPMRLKQAMPAGHSDRWRRLDTAILDRLLIEQVWGIAESEKTVEIVHHDAAAAIEQARRNGGTAAILNPLRVEDVLALAAGGERVPRKSTSFGPKPRTGLILRLFDAG